MKKTDCTLVYLNDDGEKVQYRRDVPYGQISKLIALLDELAEEADDAGDELWP